MFRKQFSPSMISLWLLLAFVLFPIDGFAQFSSNVQGTITDPEGATVPDARVILRNQQTGVDIETKTDRGGFYSFRSIVPGPYSVILEVQGFSGTEKKFTLQTQETAGVNVQLSLAKASTQITVTETTVGINPDETRLQTTIPAAQMPALPLQNRATLNIVKLAPGVTGEVENDRTDNTPIGAEHPDSRANGRPSTSNQYRLDGMPIMSPGAFGSVQIVPAPDMLRETSLQTSSFSAENGATSSLVADFTSKSGSNQFHGSADITYTGKSLWAHQAFTGTQLPFTRKWLSGALGGPVIKNRLFFFGSVSSRYSASGASGLTTYETDELVNWAKQNFPNSLGVNQLWARFRPSRAEFIENTMYARDAFPDCGTPSARNIPCDLPIQAQGYFNQSPRLNGTQYNMRLDHYFRNAQDRVFLNYFRIDQTSDFLSDRPNFDATTPSTTQFAATHWVHTFTPTLLNEAQFGWSRYWSSFGGGNLDYQNIGYGVLICCNPFYGYFSPFAETRDKDHSYRFRDFASWVKGKHTMRFGFEFAHLDYWQDRAGIFSRPFSPFFNSIWDFIDDKAQSYDLYTISAQTGQWTGQYYGAQGSQFALYVQDEWKIRSNLLLSLGLRWDDFGNPYKYGYQGQEYVQVFPGSGATDLDRILDSSVRSVPKAFSGRMNKNFLPRLGFAWSPAKSQKTSIRGGIGLYADGLNLPAVTQNLPTQPPTRFTLNLNRNNPNLPSPPPPYGTNAPGIPGGFVYPQITLNGFDSHGAPIGYPASINGTDYNLKAQKSAIWNFGVEHQFPAHTVLGLMYSGSYSWDQFYSGNYNLLPGDRLDGELTGRTTQWGKISFLRNGLRSNYNAMIVTARQTWGGLTWQGSYTWAHTLDDWFLNPANPREYYGTSDIDIRHRFSFGGVYAFPSPRNSILKAMAGNWTLGVISIFQTGAPFSVITSANYDSGGDYNADGNNYDFPNLGPNVTKSSGWTKSQYLSGIFTTSDFSKPSDAEQGTAGRNMFRQPNYFTLDANLSKKIVLPWLGDQAGIWLRLEAINALNRTNLGGVNSDLSQPNFGQVTSARQPRIVQIGARFEF